MTEPSPPPPVTTPPIEPGPDTLAGAGTETTPAPVKLAVKGLRKVFGNRPERALEMLEQGATKSQILKKTGCLIAVHDVSFEVRTGEIFVIMGLSGSGKSTVLRCLNRLIEPTAGSVTLGDVDVTSADHKSLLEIRRRKMAMVFQSFGLLPHRTVVHNVEYGLEVQGCDKEQRRRKALEALETVGLKGYENKLPRELSGGMQQRVGLARALATDAEILLMDEAFSALDPLIRRQVQDELLELQSKMNKTVVFITHDLDEALKLGGRIAIMKDGVLVQVGTGEEILTSPADDYVRAFVENVDRSKVITAGSIMHKPELVVMPKDGPALAVKRMRETGSSTVFVVDRARKLRGVVRIDDALRLVKENRSSLESVIIAEVPTTTADTPIARLLSVAATTPIPIAVIDEDRTFHGIVMRAAILAGIAGEQESP